jgi:hypothetical protein
MAARATVVPITSEPTHNKPFFRPINPNNRPINVQALLSRLSPEQLAETVDISCYSWPQTQFRTVIKNVGPQQKELLFYLARNMNDEKLEQIQEALELGSIREVEQIFADLRVKLREMGINPQEIYHTDLRLSEETGEIELHYYCNFEFSDAYFRYMYPKGSAHFGRNWRGRPSKAKA